MDRKEKISVTTGCLIYILASAVIVTGLSYGIKAIGNYLFSKEESKPVYTDTQNTQRYISPAEIVNSSTRGLENKVNDNSKK